jgi:histone H2A
LLLQEFLSVPQHDVKPKATPKVKSRAKSNVSRSKRAGLVFPVGKVHRQLTGKAPRVGTSGSVYMSAVLEYLTAELLELAGNQSNQGQRKRITPRHLTLAIRQDPELNQLLHTTVKKLNL